MKLTAKLLACIPVNKSAEANSIAVRIDPEQRAELLREQPETYYITDHYAPHPIVLIRLAKITRADLKDSDPPRRFAESPGGVGLCPTGSRLNQG